MSSALAFNSSFFSFNSLSALSRASFVLWMSISILVSSSESSPEFLPSFILIKLSSSSTIEVRIPTLKIFLNLNFRRFNFGKKSWYLRTYLHVRYVEIAKHRLIGRLFGTNRISIFQIITNISKRFATCNDFLLELQDKYLDEVILFTF